MRRRRAEMQRADMFDEGVVEERLRLLRKTEMFKKVSPQILRPLVFLHHFPGSRPKTKIMDD